MLLSWFRSKSLENPARSQLAIDSDPIGLQSVRQGLTLQQAGHLDAAVAIYRSVLNRNPRQFDALHMLGAIAIQRGKFDEAQDLIRSALLVNGVDASAHYNLAMALRQLGRTKDAVPLLRRALMLGGASAEVCILLALSLSEIGAMTEAREYFFQATMASPGSAVTHANLGAFLRRNGELQSAKASLTRAVELDPFGLSALQNLALTLLALGSVEQCLEVFARLITLPGVDAATHYAYGNALEAAGKTTQAMKQYRVAIATDSEYAKAHWGAAMAELRPIYESAYDIDESRARFEGAISALDTWFTQERISQGAMAVGSTQPFYLAYQARSNVLLLRNYGRLCARLMSAFSLDTRPTHNAPDPKRKLRVGFVSAHIHSHSVWFAITRGWITGIDPTKFEVHVFHLGVSSDDETTRARREATDFIENPRTLREWTRTILDAQLDILIYPDIGMDPLTMQLASQRLTPVQAASWGHPETTGLPTIDLFLSAELLEPTGGDCYYTERLIRLPNLGVCLERSTLFATPPNLAELGLPIGGAFLLCPGQLFKYSPEHDVVWATLAMQFKAVRNARLVFFRGNQPDISLCFENRLRRTFLRSGVDFDGTVCVIPTLAPAQFYGLMKQSTLMLDTIGFSGFNTALQGLECGLPLVAFEGDFMRGRLASGLLRRIGLDDWIATTHAEFIDKAMRLVVDESLQLQLREKIHQNSELLFGDSEPIRALEQVLLKSVFTP